MQHRSGYEPKAQKMRILDGGTKQMKRVVPLLLVIMPACSIAGMRFNPAFLSGDTEAVADLSRFEKGMTYLPVAMKSKFGSMIPLYSLVL